MSIGKHLLRLAVLSFTAALALAGVVALLWLLGLPTIQAASYTVCPAGPPDCNYSTIQAAVDAAGDGDVIQVAAGTYTGVQGRTAPIGYPDPPASGLITQVVYISKTVTILGGYTTAFADPPDPEANQTTLDAQGKGRAIFITGDISPTIEGLRITGGDAAGMGGVWGGNAGGGIYVNIATTVLSGNLVYGSTAYAGGGLCLLGSAARLSGNTVISNTADHCGGLCLLYGAVTLSGNTVISNSATGYGGGLYLDQGAPTLSGNTIIANTAGDSGGGLYLYRNDATLSSNTVTSNTAGDSGGGLYLYRSDATLTNAVVADNQTGRSGSGLYIWASSPRLLHTTIARNSGGDGSGVYVTNYGSDYSTVALTNTILFSHSVGINVMAGNAATLEGTLWYGNTKNWDGTGAIVTGTHSYWGDPLFDADGYHLLEGSAAIDKGVDAGVTTDIDGDSRDATPDLGADELAGADVYLPIILKNASP